MTGYIDKLREHSFDGIQEFDNHLPRWWLWSFYLACIFAAVYWLYYQGSSFGPTTLETFQADRDARRRSEAMQGPVTRDALVQLSKRAEAVAEGRRQFEQICSACHLADGSGSVGPNLTDKYWINGGSIEDIYRTIAKGGRANKGMVAWEPTLGRTSCKQLTAFLMTIRNTNKSGKVPEGEPFEH